MNVSTIDPRLQACPYCGSPDVSISNYIRSSHKRVYYAICAACEARGSMTSDSEQIAITAWNSIAGPSTNVIGSPWIRDLLIPFVGTVIVKKDTSPSGFVQCSTRESSVVSGESEVFSFALTAHNAEEAREMSLYGAHRQRPPAPGLSYFVSVTAFSVMQVNIISETLALHDLRTIQQIIKDSDDDNEFKPASAPPRWSPTLPPRPRFEDTGADSGAENTLDRQS